MSNHIRLPAERIEQLRLIAEAKKQTVADVITGFIRAEIAAGTIPAEVPGIDVKKAGSVITIKANGFEVDLPSDQGPTVAELLRGAAALDPNDKERKRLWLEGAAALSGIAVKRAGNGVKIVSPFTGREFPLNLNVAADLGDQIDRSLK
ncbi:hypothetical protein ACEUZ9_002031 [Paracoccus litorisediminis]|uniref:hypothetical protein n=1 Tax=Paracoccus litorisediminis TaxID=2006130 RepID=UPI00372FBC0C